MILLWGAEWFSAEGVKLLLHAICICNLGYPSYNFLKYLFCSPVTVLVTRAWPVPECLLLLSWRSEYPIFIKLVDESRGILLWENALILFGLVWNLFPYCRFYWMTRWMSSVLYMFSLFGSYPDRQMWGDLYKTFPRRTSMYVWRQLFLWWEEEKTIFSLTLPFFHPLTHSCKSKWMKWFILGNREILPCFLYFTWPNYVIMHFRDDSRIYRKHRIGDFSLAKSRSIGWYPDHSTHRNSSIPRH